MTVLNVAGLPVSVGWARPRAVAELSRMVDSANAEADGLLAAAMARNGDLGVCEVRAERARVLAAAQVAGRRIALPTAVAAGFAACTAVVIGTYLAYWWRSEADVMAWLVPSALSIVGLATVLSLTLLSMLFGGPSAIAGGLTEAEPAYFAGRDLVEVASARLVAGRERLYLVRPDGRSGAILRQVHYDAVGDCSHVNGDVLVQDEAGTEVIRLVGISGEDADAFLDYVHGRAARARESARRN